LIVNLRDSTQKGFDYVKGDVETLLHTSQRLNERVGQVESQNQTLVSRTNQIQMAHVGISAVDQEIVNSKLSGVYGVTADLDRRLQEVEAEVALIVEFRRAQAAFILGPTKAPKTTNQPRNNEPS
jgi:hypothetical protein